MYRDGASWRTLAPGLGAIGQCEMRVSRSGYTSADLSIDPSSDPDQDSVSLQLLARERACAGGLPPAGRNVVSSVGETDASVSVLVLVEETPGGATCPMNPKFPVSVTLHRSLGGRQLLDGIGHPEALILTDVFGATPCNIALKLADGAAIRVVAGVNVPMLWRTLCYAHESLDAVAARAVAGAKQGVMQVVASPPQNQKARSGGQGDDQDQ